MRKSSGCPSKQAPVSTYQHTILYIFLWSLLRTYTIQGKATKFRIKYHYHHYCYYFYFLFLKESLLFLSNFFFFLFLLMHRVLFFFFRVTLGAKIKYDRESISKILFLRIHQFKIVGYKHCKYIKIIYKSFTKIRQLYGKNKIKRWEIKNKKIKTIN